MLIFTFLTCFLPKLLALTGCNEIKDKEFKAHRELVPDQAIKILNSYTTCSCFKLLGLFFLQLSCTQIDRQIDIITYTNTHTHTHIDSHLYSTVVFDEPQV